MGSDGEAIAPHKIPKKEKKWYNFQHVKTKDF